MFIYSDLTEIKLSLNSPDPVLQGLKPKSIYILLKPVIRMQVLKNECKLPWWLVGKESPSQYRRHGFHP